MLFKYYLLYNNNSLQLFRIYEYIFKIVRTGSLFPQFQTATSMLDRVPVTTDNC